MVRALSTKHTVLILACRIVQRTLFSEAIHTRSLDSLHIHCIEQKDMYKREEWLVFPALHRVMPNGSISYNFSNLDQAIGMLHSNGLKYAPVQRSGCSDNI